MGFAWWPALFILPYSNRREKKGQKTMSTGQWEATGQLPPTPFQVVHCQLDWGHHHRRCPSHIPLTATQLSDPIHLEDARSMPLLQVPLRKQDCQALAHLILCQNPTEDVFDIPQQFEIPGHIVKRILLLRKDSHVKTEKMSIHQVRQSPHRDMRNLERFSTTGNRHAPEFD